MRRRRIQWAIFATLAAMTLGFQLVNFRHIYLALVPYHRGMAIPAAISFTFIPVAVVLANAFRTRTRDARVTQTLFAVAAVNFIGEALANLAIGVHDANGEPEMIREIADLFNVSYKFALFTGAIVYAMALSFMVAGLVWALTAAANDLLNMDALASSSRHMPAEHAATMSDELLNGHRH